MTSAATNGNCSSIWPQLDFRDDPRNVVSLMITLLLKLALALGVGLVILALL